MQSHKNGEYTFCMRVITSLQFEKWRSIDHFPRGLSKAMAACLHNLLGKNGKSNLSIRRVLNVRIERAPQEGYLLLKHE